MASLNINGRVITFSYNDTNLQIKESYKITNRKEMETILKEIRTYIKSKSNIEYNRTISEWVVEWEAHNLFYNLNMQRHRSQDVDLNEDEYGWKIKYGYPICAFLYRITNA